MASYRGSLGSSFIRLMAVARYRFILELCILFMLIWFGCAMLIYAFEAGRNTHIHSVTEAVYALLVTMTTSGDSAVAPMTLGGRTVMGFVLVLSKLLTALLCALAAGLLIERKVKEEMGLKMHKLSQHIVIIGWNLKGPQIIQTLRQNGPSSHTSILVMADTEHKPLDDPLLLFTRSPSPIRGDALKRACLSEAATIVVLADYAEKHNADAMTAVNCMMARNVNPRARLIAELLDPLHRPYLEAAGTDLLVSIGDVGGFLLAEATIGNEQAKQVLAFVAESGRQILIETPNHADHRPPPVMPTTPSNVCAK